MGPETNTGREAYSEYEEGLITQLDLTHAIARAASSIESQFDGLKIVDYRIHCNGREQPEARSLEAVKKLLTR